MLLLITIKMHYLIYKTNKSVSVDDLVNSIIEIVAKLRVISISMNNYTNNLHLICTWKRD